MISPHSIVWPSAEQGAACNWKFNDRLLEFCTILARVHLVSLIFSLPREVTVWSSEALKPLPRVPNRSKWPWCWDILIFETSETSRSIGECQGYYLWLPKIEGNWKEYTTRHPPEPLLHLPTPQDTLRYPQTLRNHPWHILRHCHSSPWHSQASLTFNRHDLTLSFPPESSLTSLDNPNASQNVWRVFWSSQSCSWGSWGVFGVPGGVFWVSRGVLGVLEGVSGLWESHLGVFSTQFPSIYMVHL